VADEKNVLIITFPDPSRAFQGGILHHAKTS
jgi:hypothetical protein